MQVTAQLLGLPDVLASVRASFSARRCNAAIATALTKTAVDIKANERLGLQHDLDRPTPYTLGSLYMKGATAERLEAQVWLKDEGATTHKGVPATRYLPPQIEGGGRGTKRFELALQAVLRMPKGWYAVPGAGAKLDAYGNVSRGQIIQILSQFRIHLTAGFDRGLTRAQDKAGQTKRNQAYGRAGGQYFAILPGDKGGLAPGIWLREGRYFGAKVGYGRNGRVRCVFRFVPRVHYKPRLLWFERARAIAAQSLPRHTQAAFADHLARVQRRGQA